ncbi:MAG TPA: hypothetical protein VJC18_04835 [bacterium]|nr:hypothetical protein [bacterium]
MDVLMAEEQKSYSEQIKNNRAMKNAHFQKRMNMLDNNIDKLKDSQSQTRKSGFFNAIVGVVGSLLSQAAQYLNTVVPGLGTAVSTALSGITKLLQSQDPFAKNAGEAQIAAEDYKKLAEYEGNRSQLYADDAESARSSKQAVTQRISKSIDNQQDSGSVAVSC